MLKHIAIKNFIFIDFLELNLHSASVIISGETGAGKSILLDAIDIGLGQRGGSDKIKQGETQAEISLLFDINKNSNAKIWLENQCLNTEEEDCIIRRILYQNGKTRNFINGRPVNATSLRDLAQFLFMLHTQHENQLFLSAQGQRSLLDAYAKTEDIVTALEKQVDLFKEYEIEIASLKAQSQDKNQRLDYLNYQYQELSQAKLNPEEVIQLPIQHKLLSSQQTLISAYESILNAFSSNQGSSLLDILQHLRQPIFSIEKISKKTDLSNLLENAYIHLNELEQSTEALMHKTHHDSNQLEKIERRLSELHQLARKHHTSVEELPEVMKKIEQDIELFNAMDKKILSLNEEQEKIKEAYQSLAQILSQERQKAAYELEKKVSQLIHELGMPSAEFKIALHPHHKTMISKEGAESIEFLLKANIDQAENSLKKVASGGELARVSLALQTALASYIHIPTLILDEIDVGVGGKVAAMIGQQLAQLSKTHQLICITHQAQIAALGQQHFQVKKQEENGKTKIIIKDLNPEERIEEIARMLAGLNITPHVMKHAQDMLTQNN